MKTKPDFLYLAQEDVLATGFRMKEAMEAVEESLILQSRGEVILPSKVILDLDEKRYGRINAMPAYLGGDLNICGIKWIAGFPGNPKRHGIPRAHAFIILNDSETGVPLALMDGTYLSAMRTGAITGVGAKFLARRDSRILGIIGCGVQARTQFMGVKAALPGISQVHAFDIFKEKSDRFCKWMKENYEVDALSKDREEDAVKGADIIITVTVADAPIVKERWLKNGCLSIHVGSYQEEEEAVILSSDKIIVDNWTEVKHRKTPLLARLYEEGKIEDKDIWCELGDIIIGAKPGREKEEERIFFASLGLGIEDVAVGAWVYKKARELNLGKKLSLWSDPVDWLAESSTG